MFWKFVLFIFFLFYSTSHSCSEGEWLKNVKHGEGAYVTKDGDMYSGSWWKGMKHGRGTYVYKKDQSQLIGKWVQNNFKEGQWVTTEYLPPGWRVKEFNSLGSRSRKLLSPALEIMTFENLPSK